jgi:hypothetical protein
MRRRMIDQIIQHTIIDRHPKNCLKQDNAKAISAKKPAQVPRQCYSRQPLEQAQKTSSLPPDVTEKPAQSFLNARSYLM